MSHAADYELEQREVIAETRELRVQVLTIGPGQAVPWHLHTDIDDTFFCLEGSLSVELAKPSETRTLSCGQRTAVLRGRPHRVSAGGGGRCRFVIVQGVGAYDYVPVG